MSTEAPPSTSATAPQGSRTALGSSSDRSERKPVTILFVNAHGGLDLSAALDAEVWHGLLYRFFSILDRGIRAHGGVVERLTGEGIKARFGAPIAHEDHARQACEAALALREDLRVYGHELRRTHGIAFSARMGLHSGEALYGPVGAEGAMTGSAQGYPAALASRMEQLAEPDTIYLTAQTADLVRDFFALEDLGEMAIRGAQRRLRVYRLVGRGPHASRIAAARAHGFDRFVGRQPELARMEAAYAAARRDQRPVMIGLAGEPGVGKTRLAEEFARRCRERGAQTWSFQALERERSTPLAFARRFTRAVLDIRDDDAPQTAREKAAGRIVLLDPELRDALEPIFDMLGVAEPTVRPTPGYESRLRRSANVIRALLDRRSDPPPVYVFDDRQWTDGASEAMTDHFFVAPFANSFVGVFAYRSGYRRPWMDATDYLEIPVLPLAEPESSEIVQSFLGSDPSLSTVAREVIERSGGNPLFLEELLRALEQSGSLVGSPGAFQLQAGSAVTHLPENLHALLVSRLDRLSPEAKLALQAAAIIGVRFDGTILRAALGISPAGLRDAITELEQAGLVTTSPDADATTHRFRHPLMTESTERSLARDQRSDLHARVAHAIAGSLGTESGPLAGEIATHWEKAGELLEASTWHRRAAQWASHRDPQQALAHWRRIRSFAPILGDVERYRDHTLAGCIAELELGWHQGIDRDEALSLYTTGRRIAESRSNVLAQARIAAAWGDVVAVGGNLEQAVLLGREACVLAERAGDPVLALGMRARLAASLYGAGNLAATLDVCAIAPDLDLAGRSSRAALPFDPTLYLRIMRGATQLDMGSFALGRATLETALEEARNTRDRFCICLGTSHLSSIPRLLGELPPDLLGRSREAVALADATGSRLLQVVSRSGLGLVLHFAGHNEEARRVLEWALEIAGQGGVLFHNKASISSVLALIFLGLGDIDAAIGHARQSLELLRDSGRGLQEIDSVLRWARVSVITQQSDPAAIARELDRALALVARTRAKSREPRVHALLGLAHIARGDRDAARLPLQRAVALYERMGSPGDLLAIRLALQSIDATQDLGQAQTPGTSGTPAEAPPAFSLQSDLEPPDADDHPIEAR